MYMQNRADISDYSWVYLLSLFIENYVTARRRGCTYFQLHLQG